MTFGEWLRTWLEAAAQGQADRTRETYKSVIERHLVPELGAIPLQKLTSVEIERYYARKRGGEKALAEATLQVHHAIIHRALATAERKRFVERNQARLVEGKPRAKRGHDDVLENVWESEEAKRFLEVACKAGPQQAAFYTLALETGMRKAELCGLKWEDVDFHASSVRVVRQLVRMGKEPTFKSPKSKSGTRLIDVSPEVTELLAAHRRHQAEIKMANRTVSRPRGCVREGVGRRHEIRCRDWRSGADEQHRSARVRQASRSIRCPADQVPRPSSHERDLGTEGGRSCEGRFAPARPRKDRHHERHLRSRAPIDAKGRGGEDGVAVEVNLALGAVSR